MAAWRAAMAELDAYLRRHDTPRSPDPELARLYALRDAAQQRLYELGWRFVAHREEIFVRGCWFTVQGPRWIDLSSEQAISAFCRGPR